MQKCRQKVELIDERQTARVEQRAIRILPLLKRLAELQSRVWKMQDRIVEMCTTPDLAADSIDEEISDLLAGHHWGGDKIDLAAARIVVRGMTQKERNDMIARLERELAEGQCKRGS